MVHSYQRISIVRILVACALMVSTLLAVRSFSQVKDFNTKKPLSTFPKKIGNWVGTEEHFPEKIYQVLGVDDSFLCTYFDPKGREIQLYIGFYKSQRKGDLIHSPKHCLPGSGWNITEASNIVIDTGFSKPKTIKAIKLRVEKGKSKQVTLYWFQSRGRFISSEYMQKIYLVWDSILRNRTDGSFIRLISPVYDSEKETVAMMKDFAKKLVPILNQYLPS